jgi:hypothetical protein
MNIVGLHRHSFRYALGFASVLLAVLTAAPGFAETAPAVLSSTGYINPTPLTAHTTAAFDSAGVSTLLAFVSTHPSWNSLPVSIAGLTDNIGNTWNVLTGPTTWAGNQNTLLSAIYYVNNPITV